MENQYSIPRLKRACQDEIEEKQNHIRTFENLLQKATTEAEQLSLKQGLYAFKAQLHGLEEAMRILTK